MHGRIYSHLGYRLKRAILEFEDQNKKKVKNEAWVEILRDKISPDNPGKIGDEFFDNLSGVPDATVLKMRFVFEYRSS